MKKLSKLLALLLAAVICFSCLGVSAFASSVKQYGKVDEATGRGGYIAFGDSVARGYGVNGRDLGNYNLYNNRVIPNSYPAVVAEAVGCTVVNDASSPAFNNFVPVCFSGMTLSAAMDLLGIEDDYYDEVYDHGHGDFLLYPLMEKYYSGARDFLVNNATLVTIGLGLSDVAYAPIRRAMEGREELDADFVKAALENMAEGLEYYKRAYPLLLSFIKENNPDATVVLIGNYNVGGDMPVSDDILLPVGHLVTAMVAYTNSYLKQWAEEYGYIYCDITNAETVAAQNDMGVIGEFLDDVGYYGHLSVEGYAYVCRQILELLEEEPSEATNDIAVDLGRFTSVSYVMLDGILLDKSDYSMDGYKLVIPNDRPTAKLLTVAVIGENGKVTVNTYTLSYSCEAGYSAYLISGIDDVSATAKKASMAVYSVAKKAVTAISGFFKTK